MNDKTFPKYCFAIVFGLATLSQTLLAADLILYEGFYTPTEGGNVAGFSDTNSIGLSGAWSSTKDNILGGSIKSRTSSTGWSGAGANINNTFPIKPNGLFNFVEIGSSGLAQAQINLATPVNLASGTYYMSFVTTADGNDYIGQVGLADSGSGMELMFGQGWSTGTGCHYASSSSVAADPGCRGNLAQVSRSANQDVVLYIGKIQKSGTSVTIILYGFNLNTLSNPLPLTESAASALWTNTLTGVSISTFNKLEFELSKWSNYPTVSQIRLGTTWASVMGATVSVPVNVVWNGGGTNNNWSNGSNWVSGVAPVVGDYLTFAGTTQTTANMDASFYIGSLTFDSTAGSFTITNSNNTLIFLTGGLTNNSINTQTLDVPVALTGTQFVNAASGNITISRTVSGNGGLALAGGGTVTLSGANTYTGNTAIQGGSLVLANSSNATYAGAISGTATLVKSGAGVLTLTGTNSFTGTTTVSNGTLIVMTATGQSLGSSITVIDDATLGVVASTNGNYLSPASLTVGSSTGARLQFGLAGTNTAPLNPGTLALVGTTTIYITNCPYATNHYPLFTGYTGGTLVLGSQPTGWHGILTVSGTTVYYTVTSLDASAKPFIHPGCLNTTSDFARIRAKVQAGQEPWASGWNKLANTHLVKDLLGYTGSAWPYLVRQPDAAPCDFKTSQWGQWDAAQAYEMSVYWQVTGDNRYADTAIGILNNWANTCISVCGGPDSELQSMQGYQFACAAENLRNYPNWAAADFAKFQNWMLTVWYPDVAHWYLVAHMGTCGTFINGNWDLGAMDLMIAIGVVCDRRDIYNEAIEYYKNGSGNGAARNLLWYMHPGYMGQHQESGRDQGHATLDPILLGVFCEIAWNQGDDIYAYNNNGLLALSEYTTKYNLGYDVPFKTWYNCGRWGGDWPSVNYWVSDWGRYMTRAGNELIWNHYENRKGLAAPYTKAAAMAMRPEGGGWDFGVDASGAYDQTGFTTLSHVRDTLTNPPAPSGLWAQVNNRSVTLSWFGSANATSYNVKRSQDGGASYTTLASGMALDHFCTDTCLVPGTNYYYVVSAMVNGVETTNSLPVLVQANQLLTGTVIGSTGSYNNWGFARDWAFDGETRTYYDAYNTSGDWTGLDLGVANVITKIGYAPKAGNASRMVGGRFQGCNVADFSSGVVTLFTVVSAPADFDPTWNSPPGVDLLTYQTISNPTAFRYVRYIGPTGAGCNVSEIQFYGYSTTAPLPPTGVTAIGRTAQVTVNWTPSAGASSFNVKRSQNNGGPYTPVATGVTAASYTDAGLTNGTTYYYVVSAVNDTLEGADSGQVSAIPAFVPTPDVTWSGALNGTWDTNTLNWQTGMAFVKYQNGNAVLFDDSSSPNTTVNIAAPISPASIAFNNNWRGYNLSGSSIGGTGVFTKQGGGSVFLTSANSFSGGATLYGGNVTIQNVNSLGSGPLTLSGGTFSTYGVMTFAKNITIAGGGSIQLGSANNLTLSGTLSGSGWLTLGNDGNSAALYLSGANTMTDGSITLANNNNSVHFSTALAGNANTDWTFNNTQPAHATFDFASGTIAFGSLAGSGVIQGYYSGSQNVIMQVGGNNHSTTFSGVIHNNASGSGTIGLTKVGMGTLTLAGANDYTGATTINAGAIITSTASKAIGNYTVVSGAKLGVNNTVAGSALVYNLTVSDTATLEFQNVASATSPLIMASNVTVNGSCVVSVIPPNSGIGLGVYPLVRYSGQFVGDFANLQLQLPSGMYGTLVSNANEIAVSIGVLPTPLAPATLTATPGIGQVALNWSACAYASGYNIWRSLSSGTGYSLVGNASGTSYTDTGLVNQFKYYYILTATNAFGSSGSSPEAYATPFPAGGKLTGTIIGTPGSYNNGGDTIYKVFDNNLTTFFDGPTSDGCWAGLDFGSGKLKAITQVRYCPRTGQAGRMTGGVFQGDNSSSFSTAVTLGTVGSQPTEGVFTSLTIDNHSGFRYVRYLAPNGGWGNVAEVEFYGYSVISTTPVQMGAQVVGNQLRFSWPVDRIGWHLEAQTNSLGVGLGSNWFAIPGSDTVNQFLVPIDSANDSVFYRLVYP